MPATNDPLVTAAAIANVVLMAFGTGWYAIIAYREKNTPSPTTWLLFFLATTLSLITYTNGENHNLIANIGNVSDPLTTGAALIVVIKMSRWNDWKEKKDLVVLLCLLATAVIFLFWVKTSEHDAANLAAQSIISIAYVPTLRKVWKSDKDGEPLRAWGMLWLGCAASAYPAFASNGNLFSRVYAIRAIVSVGSLIAVILIARHRAKLKRAC